MAHRTGAGDMPLLIGIFNFSVGKYSNTARTNKLAIARPISRKNVLKRKRQPVTVEKSKAGVQIVTDLFHFGSKWKKQRIP
jgi:F420-0:gamma-glutamyl ligase-like protein